MFTTFYGIYFQEQLIYVGSTTDFNTRKLKHKRCFLQTYSYDEHNNIYLYNQMRSLSIDYANFIYKILETQILHKKERFEKEKLLIEALNPLYNKNKPTSSYQETYCRIRKWQDEHKEYLSEKHKEKNICGICGGKYTTVNKSTHCKTLKHLNALNNHQEEHK
jgi:hypothetical protein